MKLGSKQDYSETANVLVCRFELGFGRAGARKVMTRCSATSSVVKLAGRKPQLGT